MNYLDFFNKKYRPTSSIENGNNNLAMLNKSYELSSLNFSVLDFRNIDRMTIRRGKPFSEMIEIKLNDIYEGEI